MANSVDPDQTAIGAVCSGSTLFAFILNLSVMLGNYLQQTTFFSGLLRVKRQVMRKHNAETCGFQQCGILTIVDSEEPVPPLFQLLLSLETPNDVRSVA